MRKTKIFITSAALVGVVALIGGTAVAYGQSHFGWFGGTQDQFQAMVSEKLADIAQIRHKNVCDISAGDDVVCTAKVVVDSDGKAKAASLPSGYGPKQFLGAYNLGSGLSSKTPGPIIAIVDAYDDPNVVQDLSKYDTTYGIPALPACSGSIASSKSACIERMNESGKTNSLPRSNSSWDLEISLDVQIAHATCENCRILLVEANSASFTDLLKAIDTAVANNAVVVSGSWGASEFSTETAYDSHFQHPGTAFTFSAGDGGYATLIRPLRLS